MDAADGKGAPGFVTGLQVRLTADHNGLPAGTEVMVGYAEASAKAVASAPSPKKKHRRVANPAKREGQEETRYEDRASVRSSRVWSFGHRRP